MMNETDVSVIARRLNLQEWQVRNSLYLFEQGATVPFVSRYRKEKTGTLDEIQLFEIEKLSVKLTELNARRQTILETIRSQKKLTPELEEQINKADTLTLLEDLYLPYKPKRKTRASIARSLGLEPLARMIMGQNIPDLEHRAEDFLNDQVKSAEEALAGARDIAAEWINENRQVRECIRRLFEREAIIRSKIIRGKEDEGRKYVNYFDSSENLNKCPSHRLLAMLRGEREKLLHLSIEPDEEKAVRLIEEMVIHRNSASAVQLQIAIPDAYKRLLKPSIENEYRAIYKEKADEAAISVFAENLRQLLLMPPLGQKSILAIDPGYRTGCKIVCLDPQGQLVHNETVYPHPPQREVGPAARKI
ncbi:MAG: RNA-binding transcriptional accessory protein, partial [Bacteroidales bacterium]|nr:RNA-binding transcriptional accessory protein [Bacteroidales bacterium]